MYWLTPFKYLLEGFLALLVQGQQIRCDTNELAMFPPPPGQDCQTYAGEFAQQSGGYVETQLDGTCGFCQYATGEAFAASFNVFPQYIWRDFGMCDLYCFEMLLLTTLQASCGSISSSTSQSYLSAHIYTWVACTRLFRYSSRLRGRRRRRRRRSTVVMLHRARYRIVA